MQKLANCELIIDIDMIESITGPIPHFEIIFSTIDKKKHKLIFEHVWDMRYSIENASLVRFDGFRKHSSKELVHNGIYIVEESEYIKYFEYQVDETLPADGLTHYIVIDPVDTIIDILVDRSKPTLTPMG